MGRLSEAGSFLHTLGAVYSFPPHFLPSSCEENSRTIRQAHSFRDVSPENPKAWTRWRHSRRRNPQFKKDINLKKL